MGARPYDPSLGRFHAIDPIEGGSLNNYDYAGRDPIGKYDLTGRELNPCANGRQCMKTSTKRSGWGKIKALIDTAVAAVIGFSGGEPVFLRNDVLSKAVTKHGVSEEMIEGALQRSSGRYNGFAYRDRQTGLKTLGFYHDGVFVAVRWSDELGMWDVKTALRMTRSKVDALVREGTELYGG
jgi:hypothetical protein